MCASSCQNLSGQSLADELRERADEGWIVVERLDAIELEAELGGPLARLDVEVPQDLEVIRDEADGADEHAPDPVRREPVELLQDVRSEPRFSGRTGALESERPVREPGALGDEARALEELVAVGIAVPQDSLRQRVSGEDDVAVEPADTLGQSLEERFVVVPALDEDELGSPFESPLQPLPVAGDREAREVRRQH